MAKCLSKCGNENCVDEDDEEKAKCVGCSNHFHVACGIFKCVNCVNKSDDTEVFVKDLLAKDQLNKIRNLKVDEQEQIKDNILSIIQKAKEESELSQKRKYATEDTQPQPVKIHFYPDQDPKAKKKFTIYSQFGSTYYHIYYTTIQDVETFSVLQVAYRLLDREYQRSYSTEEKFQFKRAKDPRFGDRNPYRYYVPVFNEKNRADYEIGKTLGQQANFNYAERGKYVIAGVSYLETGHLAAKADFKTTGARNASYDYLNAAPMWNTINGRRGNWAFIENGVRSLVKTFKDGLEIKVGTIGIMTLEGKEMYLDQEYGKFPIPRYVYKIVEELSEVYIVFNNPYVKKNDIEAEVENIFGNVDQIDRNKCYTATSEDREDENSVKFLTDGCVPKGFAFKMSTTDFKEKISKLFPGNDFLKGIEANATTSSAEE